MRPQAGTQERAAAGQSRQAMAPLSIWSDRRCLGFGDGGHKGTHYTYQLHPCVPAMVGMRIQQEHHCRCAMHPAIPMRKLPVPQPDTHTLLCTQRQPVSLPLAQPSDA